MAEKLVEDGATILISFGLAGGLDPALPAGALLAPLTVLWQGRTYPCDEAMRASLLGESVTCHLGGDMVIATSADKLRIWRETGASSVDMESGPVAEVAAAAGLRFAVLRAICDPATRDLPSAAVEALDEQGRIAPLKMVGILARHPLQILGLIALGRDAARARSALVGGAESLGRLAARDANLGSVL